MENLDKLSKKEKNTMKQLTALASSGNSRACLILSILNEATPSTKKFHLKLITPMLAALPLMKKSFKDPKFRDSLKRKKGNLNNG